MKEVGSIVLHESVSFTDLHSNSWVGSIAAFLENVAPCKKIMGRVRDERSDSDDTRSHCAAAYPVPPQRGPPSS